MLRAPLTIGIEEEYQIIDPETRALTSYVQQLINRGRVVLGDQVKQEFMQSQVEVGSHICRNIQEAREELIRLRSAVGEIANENDCVIAAASTHPFSRWEEQEISEGERYKDLETSMQEVGRRLLIFGMHIHLGFGKTPEALELLIDIQNQLRYFLPHILALTTSSPFWHGRNTGLKSYRSIIFESLPRTGIPPSFSSFSDYQQFITILSKVGSLGKGKDENNPDATKIWWDARPQPGLGTLEVRVADACTTVDEAICIAAIIQSLVAKLIKLRNQNRSWRVYRSELIAENKWRAVRYGIDGKLIDFGIAEEVPLRFLIRELLEVIDDVLDELGTRDDVNYVHTILKNGSSADRQLATYRKRIDAGDSKQDALKAVVDQLIEETQSGW
ncbi:MAG: carboxylate-amine ligase [Chloroflexi bacterium]|nr:MAG: carboxylate-amine ligase [Phototrophicales bacterium]RMF79663.1 MAG: carboxylate-amine ligase [Chloroflexota bacterium]